MSQFVDKNYDGVGATVDHHAAQKLAPRERYSYLLTNKPTKYQPIPRAKAPSRCVESYELEFSQAGTSQSAAGYKCVKNIVEAGGRPLVNLQGMYDSNLRERYRYSKL
jgi:hypothetical protein